MPRRRPIGLGSSSAAEVGGPLGCPALRREAAESTMSTLRANRSVSPSPSLHCCPTCMISQTASRSAMVMSSPHKNGCRRRNMDSSLSSVPSSSESARHSRASSTGPPVWAGNSTCRDAPEVHLSAGRQHGLQGRTLTSSRKTLAACGRVLV